MKLMEMFKEFVKLKKKKQILRWFSEKYVTQYVHEAQNIWI